MWKCGKLGGANVEMWKCGRLRVAHVEMQILKILNQPSPLFSPLPRGKVHEVRTKQTSVEEEVTEAWGFGGGVPHIYVYIHMQVWRVFAAKVAGIGWISSGYL